jgi:hypothetical protein
MCSLLLSTAVLLACQPSARANEADLVRLWQDLARVDAVGYRAVWALVDQGDKAVVVLAARLKVPGNPDARIVRLLRDLDDDDFETREAATEKLISLGSVAELPVRRLFHAPPSVEVRRRCEIILSKIESASRALSDEELRGVRAVHVLEQIGTPAAIELLNRYAAGPPGLRLTEDAKRALEQMKGFNLRRGFPFP